MKKWKNKYRVESSRLKEKNYGRAGSYFITICTRNRKHYFGEITDEGMQLNGIGKLAHQYWNEIPNHFENIKLANFIIMPNHMHGILMLSDVIQSKNYPSFFKEGDLTKMEDSNPIDNSLFMSNISPKSGSISTIIRSYKSIVTREAHKTIPDFNWQSRYYDSIIWDEESFLRIQKYIEDNPKKWWENRNSI